MQTIYRGPAPDTGRWPSRHIWYPLERDYSFSPGEAIHVFEDFIGFGDSAAVAANVGRYVGQGGCYRSYEDTGNTIAPIATDRAGACKVTTDATDNDESWLQLGAATGVCCQVNKDANSPKLLAFECRVKAGQIATGNMFFGLAEEGSAVADFITDAGAMVDKDFIGFSVLEANSDKVRFVYRKNGQTEQVVIANIQTLVADTYYKFGFLYLPSAPADERVSVYVNGSKQNTYITKTNLEAATFPEGEEMSPIFGGKNSSAAANNWTADWYRLYQPLIAG